MMEVISIGMPVVPHARCHPIHLEGLICTNENAASFYAYMRAGDGVLFDRDT